MKKIGLFSGLVIMIVSAVNPQTKHVVMVSNYSFTPKDINITVGDTVEWRWEEGMHTTTSDDISGSDVWDQPITISNPVFSIVITTPGLHDYHCTPHLSFGMVGSINATSPTSIDEEINFVNKFRLYQNYPNPFNPSTNLAFDIGKASQVSLKLYDVLGNLVRTLVNEVIPEGKYIVNFNASELTSGIYFYQLNAGNFTSTKQMILMK